MLTMAAATIPCGLAVNIPLLSSAFNSSLPLGCRRRLKTQPPRKEPWLRSSYGRRCRCSALPGGVDFENLGYDLYELLGVESKAEPGQIRTAYRWLQKKCHPDITGPDGHYMSILLNQAYSVLSDPDARFAYDQIRGETLDLKGYTGQPLYSKWFGSASEDRAVFVDEVKCIGCLKCAFVAPKTFAIETVYGRARAVAQWADSEDTVEDAMRACPVDCISWVERANLPALEFLMSKQPRVAVRLNNSVGARTPNVFAEAELLLKKLRNEKQKATKFEESPAQREARMKAVQQIRTSAGWWWHHVVGKQATEYTNYQRASKGAIVPLNWKQQSTTDAHRNKDSNGSDKYQKIGITQELSEAAARLRSGILSSTSTQREALHDEDYWVPLEPKKSGEAAPSPAKEKEIDRSFLASLGESQERLTGGEAKEVNMKQRKRDEYWKKTISSLSGIPLATSVGAAIIVGFGSGGGEAGGLDKHLAGPLAVQLVNSFSLQVFLAATVWYIIGTVLASLIAVLVVTRERL